MNPPRWFYVVVAVAMILISGSIAVRNLRDTWTLQRNGDVFNARTGEVCAYNNGNHLCVNVVNGRRRVFDGKYPAEVYDSIRNALAAGADTGMKMMDSTALLDTSRR